jgi:hypothetical protein
MTWLLFVLLALLVVLLGRACVVEARQQRRHTAVAKALAPPATPSKVPEFWLMLSGGPCDGGRMILSASLATRLRREHPFHMNGGRYALTGQVEFPDGGALLQYEWVAAKEHAA